MSETDPDGLKKKKGRLNILDALHLRCGYRGTAPGQRSNEVCHEIFIAWVSTVIYTCENIFPGWSSKAQLLGRRIQPFISEIKLLHIEWRQWTVISSEAMKMRLKLVRWLTQVNPGVIKRTPFAGELQVKYDARIWHKVTFVSINDICTSVWPLHIITAFTCLQQGGIKPESFALYNEHVSAGRLRELRDSTGLKLTPHTAGEERRRKEGKRRTMICFTFVCDSPNFSKWFQTNRSCEWRRSQTRE